MSKRYKALRRQRYRDGIRRCQNCHNVKLCVLCFLPEPPRFFPSDYGRGHFTAERAPDETLCVECAQRAGFCYSCGDFWAGIESFDFIHPGLCEHCHDQIKSDSEDFNEEDDYLWEIETACP